ncbi:MAG: hypothetical protein NTV92_09370, partial [Candidatus Bipolaricaulota bacterium]|nr:hypothetical protein [Candidatus Bipolaricaulota bacterium]
MANGLNPTERAIVVVITFVIAIVLSVTLDKAGVVPLPLVAATFLVPLALGARALRIRAGVAFAFGMAVIQVVLLLLLGERNPGYLVALCAGDVALGAAFGAWNQRKQSRAARW